MCVLNTIFPSLVATLRWQMKINFQQVSVTVGRLAPYQECVCRWKEVTECDSSVFVTPPPPAEIFSERTAGMVVTGKIPNSFLGLGGRDGWRDAEERGEGMGWDGERKNGERRGGGGAQQLAPFFLSLSLVAVSVRPIWWKSNSTLALIMWQLEFTYLVNPASGFRFQLISLWLLHPPRGWWEQGGGGEPAVWVRSIQYDGEGWGEGKPYIEKREMAKMPAQHIQLHRAGPGGSTCLIFLP